MFNPDNKGFKIQNFFLLRAAKLKQFYEPSMMGLILSIFKWLS